MSDAKSNWAENGFLDLLYNATTWAGIAQNHATPLATFYLALHSSSPADAGNQTTNEVSYGAYARVAVARTSGGFTVSGNQVTLAADKDFPEATSGTATATHFSIGTLSTGAGNILHYGTVTPNISISTGVTPRLTTGTTITEQ